jgi:RNA polymerase sigma-70 factor, ECF subfamily
MTKASPTPMSDPSLIAAMADVRARFLELVRELRPELHRYCTRMTGSVFTGEDVVQETLAKAYFALSELGEPPPLRGWLFRIAHNTAMDFLRRYEHRHVELVAEAPELVGEPESPPDPTLVSAALTYFVALPPVQRSAVVLKDVLGHSLEETASAMGTTVLAIKSALWRGRANLASRGATPPTISADEFERLEHYAALFNSRDWDGLRALLAEEARLDLVSRWQRHGKATGQYFSRYAEIAATDALRAEVGFAEGVAVIAITSPAARRPPSLLRLTWEDGRITLIRDYHYVPYLTQEAPFTKA